MAAQARDRGRIGERRRGVAQQQRAGLGGLAGDIEQVLHRHRQTCKRGAFDARLQQRIGMAGCGARGVGIDVREDMFGGGFGSAAQRCVDRGFV